MKKETNFKVLWSMLTLFLLVFSSNVWAQEAEPMFGDEDRIYYPHEIQTFSSKDLGYDRLCYKVNFEANELIQFEKSNTLYLRANASTFKPQSIEVSVGGERPQKIAFNRAGEVVLENLQKTGVLTISAQNSCGVNENILQIDLSKKTSLEELVVSSVLFKELAQFTKVKSKKTLIDILKEESKVSVYEKVSFYQRYFLKGDLLTVDIPVRNGKPYFPTDISIPPPPPTGCNCEMITAQPFVTPGDLNPQGQLPQNDPNGLPGQWNSYNALNVIPHVSNNNAYWTSNQNRGLWTRAASKKGPAKAVGVSGLGKRIHSRTITNEDENFSTHKAQINMNWMCTDERGILSDCGCRRDVNYTGKYDTRLQTNMGLPSCFLCGNKGGKSKAEDWATLLLFDAEGMINILAVGGSVVASECSEHFNQEFFTKAIDLAKDIANVILTVNGDDVSAGSIVDLAGDILDSVVELIATPVKDVVGCHVKNRTANLVHNYGSFSLKPNNPTYILLSSRGVNYVHGYTSWNGYAKTTSSFNLAIGAKGGQLSEKCCTDGIGAWALENYPGAPVNFSALQNEVGAFINNLFLPYDGSAVGVLWVDEECKDE